MGVQLNIKDETTVTLARALASRLGISVTSAIRTALEEKTRATAIDRDSRVDAVMALVDKAQDLIAPEFRGVEMSRLHGDLLYDDDGSFK